MRCAPDRHRDGRGPRPRCLDLRPAIRLSRGAIDRPPWSRADRAMTSARRGLLRLGLFALAASGGGCAAAPPAPRAAAGMVVAPPVAARAPVDAALAARLAGLRARLDALGRETFAFWQAHGPDAQHGGFYGTLDRRGDSVAPTDKGLIQTARHLWAMSTWYQRK